MGTAEDLARLQAAASSVLVTTGDVQAKYQPLKIVFAVGGSGSGLFKTASPQEAFERASQALQAAAVALQGHAVVHCSFGYNAYTTSGCGGGTNFTVHGYGTAVRFI
jgi:uncharacterized protein YbjQ (UPF0145 family)